MRHTPSVHFVKTVSNILVLVISLSWYSLFVWLAFPDPQGTDFYPLYVAATALLHGFNPYSAEVSQMIADSWWVAQGSYQVALSVAYPLPFLLLMLPFSLFPVELSATVWCMLLLALSILSFRLVARDNLTTLLPFVFYPLFHAAVLKTSSLLWFAFLMYTVFGFRSRSPLLVGLSMSLLTLKPQVGGLFFVVLMLLSFRERRKVFWYSCFFTAVLWGLSFILSPDWVVHWLDALTQYQQSVVQAELPASAFLLLLFSVVLPWQIPVAFLQSCIFLLNDLYSSLPLLVAWGVFKPRVALLGCALSWLAPLLFSTPNNTVALWLLVFVPLLFACALAQLSCFDRYQRLRPFILRDNVRHLRGFD